MELSLIQIQALKKEIEAIWTHLDRIERHLTAKPQASTGHSGSTAEPREPRRKTPTNETIAILEKMKQKIEDQERESKASSSDMADEAIDQALFKADVTDALKMLKQKLGIQ